MDLADDVALDQAFAYYDAVVQLDISRVDGRLRNPERVKLFMRSYARNQGTQAASEVIRRDMEANDTAMLNPATVCSYLQALERIFVVEEMKAWNPNLGQKL